MPEFIPKPSRPRRVGAHCRVRDMQPGEFGWIDDDDVVTLDGAIIVYGLTSVFRRSELRCWPVKVTMHADKTVEVSIPHRMHIKPDIYHVQAFPVSKVVRRNLIGLGGKELALNAKGKQPRRPQRGLS